MINTNPSPAAFCKKGSANDPVTIETSSMGITDLRTLLSTNPTAQMSTTFQSANATLAELTEEFHTANDGLPPVNPCASSTRRKEVLTNGTSDEPIKSTRGRSFSPPAANEEIPRTSL